MSSATLPYQSPHIQTSKHTPQQQQFSSSYSFSSSSSSSAAATIADDYEDSTSETHEALTPTTSDSHPPSIHTRTSDSLSSSFQNLLTEDAKPLTIDNIVIPSPISIPAPKSPDATIRAPLSPTSPTSPKRTMSEKVRSFFRRSNSHSGYNPTSIEQKQTTTDATTSILTDPVHAKPPVASAPSNELAASSQTPMRKASISVSAHTSPWHSPAVTPSASNGSPSSTIEGDLSNVQHPKKLSHANRASTGFSFKRSAIAFHTPSGHDRSGSTNNAHAFPLDQIEEVVPATKLAYPDFISRPAATGAGLKARRLSINLPDEFQVDTIELDKEFTSASKLPGRRKTIGTGATCNVKLYVRKGHGDEVYAIKEFRKRGTNEDANEYDKKVKSEYTIAHSLHHPNIVESVRLCTHSGRWNVVMEYCSVGEIYSLVEKRYFQLEDKLCIFKQTVRGVAYLHSHGIAHRDIKLENLLMTDQGKVKITDFGVSEVFTGEHPGLRAAGGECGKNMGEIRRCSPGLCGSLPYMAPEVIAKEGDYDPRPLDVWSCGVLLLTLIYGGNVWQQAHVEKDSTYAKFANPYLKFVEANPEEPFPLATTSLGPFLSNKGLPKPAIRALLIKMLHPNPDKRCSIQDVMNDRYFKTVECCSEEYVEDGGAPLALKRTNTIDASKSISGNLKVQKLHNHLPPKQHRLPQHRFDMGHGWN